MSGMVVVFFFRSGIDVKLSTEEKVVVCLMIQMKSPFADNTLAKNV